MWHSSIRTLITAGTLSVLAAACGGGGGSSNMDTAGMASVSLTDAPGDYDNVWVTVSAVWFHKSDTAGPDDADWVKFPLNSPVTVDLLTLQNGTLSQAFNNLQLPTGSYHQIRVFLVAPDAALAASASAQNLNFNDQVNYQDASDTEQSAPLELANPAKGVALHGSFTVTANSTLALALDFDINRDVLKFFVGNSEDFILKPRLAYFDLSHVGAIKGSVNCANLKASGGTGFAEGVVIKAESLSADGTYHVVDRETGLKLDIAGNACRFTLFPLHVPVGSNSTTYDVMIRGRHMQTMFVQGVAVSAGTDAVTATQLNATPLALTQGNEYTANMPANMPVVPTGGDVQFYQTLPGSSAPYEVRFRALNPFTGIFTDDEPLSLGPVEVGSYMAGGDPVLAPVTPNEGLGGFLPYGSGPYLARTAATSGTLMPPVSGVGIFTVGALSIASPASADSISGAFTQGTANKYDSGYLIVSHDGYIVTTLPLGPTLGLNGGTGGAYAIANIPGGSSSQSFAPGLYYLHGIVWNSAHPFLTLRRVSGAAVVDLRSGSATNVDLQVN